MAVNLLPPPILLPMNARLRRSISVSARASAPASPSDDAKRRRLAPLFRSIVREAPISEEDPKSVAETSEAGTESSERRARLTAEKARVLRREMRATETWHNAMYHSAIASRLASPDD